MSTRRRDAGGRINMNPDEDITSLTVRKASEVQPLPRTRTSKYEELIAQAACLSPGQVLEISVREDGDDLEMARRRISAMIRRQAQPLTKHTLTTRMTATGTIGVFCT